METDNIHHFIKSYYNIILYWTLHIATHIYVLIGCDIVYTWCC